MKGGTRSNRRINPDSVHSLLPNTANDVRTALENMEPGERLELYKQLKEGADDIETMELFEDIFREKYPHELAAAKAAAYATPSWKTATEADFDSSIYDLLKHGPKGGKTRRNRRGRRGRGRGRRSLKRYSKRRR